MSNGSRTAIATSPPWRDLLAGLAVYLVALPLCLGVALASDAPLSAGIISGIVGGLVVAVLSGSHTSVSGPAAGLTAIVAGLIAELGTFQAFLVAAVLGGVLQIGLGMLRAGFIAAFFPSSVIKGLLAGIGIILILKQLPHVIGYAASAEGHTTLRQPNGETTFSDLLQSAPQVHPGAAIIGLGAVALLLLWNGSPTLSRSPVPGALIAALFGTAANALFVAWGVPWAVGGEYLVQVPVMESASDAGRLLVTPDWSALSNPKVYLGAVTLALIASLETLLNLEATDQLDPEQRHSPPNRELMAQGVGNIVAGLMGGLPLTSVIVRSSVNINANAKTKRSAMFHGVFLLGSVLFAGEFLNSIPLAALAAILLVTGLKLANPSLARSVWRAGPPQSLPFVATVLFIIAADLLVGVLVGLAAAITFILWSNYRRPLRTFSEHHLGGEVMRIELPNQVSFLNRATLDRALRQTTGGSHVLVDARSTDYIDPDVVALIENFKGRVAPAHAVTVSLLGFKHQYQQLPDQLNFHEYSTRELQSSLTPDKVIETLLRGNERYCDGKPLQRNLPPSARVQTGSSAPLAVILGCADCDVPVEHVFDLGPGDLFSVQVLGNLARSKVLASIEYGAQMTGARVIVVMGHTDCGAIKAMTARFVDGGMAPREESEHLTELLDELAKSMPASLDSTSLMDGDERAAVVADVARRNVLRTMGLLTRGSRSLARLLESGDLTIVGAMYDAETGRVSVVAPRAVASDAPQEPLQVQER